MSILNAVSASWWSWAFHSSWQSAVVGLSPEECKIVFRMLPNSPLPSGEVEIGEFKKGDLIPFCMKTSFGEDFWVSTSKDTQAAKVAFQDADGKLGLDDGSILEQIKQLAIDGPGRKPPCPKEFGSSAFSGKRLAALRLSLLQQAPDRLRSTFAPVF